VRCVRAHAHARGFREKDALDRHAQEVAFELALQAVARPRAELAADFDAVGVAELGAQAGRYQVQRRFVHRRALQRVHRTFVGVAVLLQATLEQDRHCRLAAGRGSEQQQQPAADVGARSSGLEVVDYAAERFVDAEQLALEQFFGAGGLTAVGCTAVSGGGRIVLAEPAEHVPQVFMAGARQLPPVARHDRAQELAECAGPVLRTVEPAVRAQCLDEALATLRASSRAV
jgi:hypothetical protein